MPVTYSVYDNGYLRNQEQFNKLSVFVDYIRKVDRPRFPQRLVSERDFVAVNAFDCACESALFYLDHDAIANI
jgi:hypothetical protein